MFFFKKEAAQVPPEVSNLKESGVYIETALGRACREYGSIVCKFTKNKGERQFLTC